VSAIAGVYHRDGHPAHRASLERMIGALAHRGPDGGGVWTDGAAGLGHQALRTTKESLGEKWPLRNAAGDLALTADARLDNREELKKALEVGGLKGDEPSDGDLILRAYEEWGERCPERLLGDFVFAVWDARRERLFCARDHLGVKPFYYHLSERRFCFASEIKALMCLPDTPRRLNEERVADYLGMCFEDKASTFYRGIHRLPPGHSLVVSREEPRRRAYWALDLSREIRLDSNEEYARAFRELFEEAVGCRLRGSTPPGVLLSGGLDSSSIARMARGLLDGDDDRPLKTFSASFPDFPKADEDSFIREVLAGKGFDPHFINVDHLSPLMDLEEVYWHEDEPFQAPNLFVYWALAKAAQQEGVRVLLDGVDGDTTVGHGFEHLTELVRSGRWRTAASEMLLVSKRFRCPLWRLLWHYGLKPLAVDPALKRGRTALRLGLSSDAAASTLMRREFADRIGWNDRYRSLLGDRLEPARAFREEHWRQLTSGIVPCYLEVCDKAAAAFGIDHRHPYFDKRLVEFCLALPAEQRLSQGWDRAIQRRAMADVIPRRIASRTGKSNWGRCFERGLVRFSSQLIEELLRNPGLLESYVDVSSLGRAYRRSRPGRMDGASVMSIWTAVTLGLWLKQAKLAA